MTNQRPPAPAARETGADSRVRSDQGHTSRAARPVRSDAGHRRYGVRGYAGSPGHPSADAPEAADGGLSQAPKK